MGVDDDWCFYLHQPIHSISVCHAGLSQHIHSVPSSHISADSGSVLYDDAPDSAPIPHPKLLDGHSPRLLLRTRQSQRRIYSQLVTNQINTASQARAVQAASTEDEPHTSNTITTSFCYFESMGCTHISLITLLQNNQ